MPRENVQVYFTKGDGGRSAIQSTSNIPPNRHVDSATKSYENAKSQPIKR